MIAAVHPVFVGRGARGAESARRFAVRLSEELAPHGVALRIRIPETVEVLEAEVVRAARGEGAHEGRPAPCLFVAGGDGTLRRVARALLASGVAHFPTLGVLPFGTVNVVARDLGLPLRPAALASRIVEAVRENRTRPYDVGFVRTPGSPRPEPFLLSAGFGLEGEAVARTATRVKRWLGAAAFLATAATIDLEGLPLLEVQARGVYDAGTLVAVLNSGRYGGPFRPLGGDASDGVLDVFVARPRTRRALAAVALRAAAGRLGAIRLARFCVRARAEAAYHLDGDPAGALPAGATAEITLRPRALRFFA